MTTVSVVIPAFNRADTIRPAIDSVLGQQCDAAIELIVVDDGSSDDLASALRPYGSRLACVRHPRNRGAAAARNSGVTAAAGDYVAFLDSDDEWLPGKLARQLDAMRDRQWRASCTACYLARPGSPEIVSPRRATGPVTLADLAWGCYVSPGTTLMFERRLFDEVGPLDTNLGRLEDWDWLLRYAGRQDLGFIAEPLARVHLAPRPNAAPVVAAVAALRAKHAAQLRGADRRHFEAALDFELAAAFHRAGRFGKALPALIRSWARAPFDHAALSAVLHNRRARG